MATCASKFVVTYSGQAIDKNQYFYKLVLKIRRVAKIEDLRLGMGGLWVESTDEGVVTDLQSLIS